MMRRLSIALVLVLVSVPAQAQTRVWSNVNFGANASIVALASLTPAANKMPYFTSASAAALADLSAAARTVLDDASVGAMVDTLGGAAASGTGGLVRATAPTIATSLAVSGAANTTTLTLTGGTQSGSSALGLISGTATWDTSGAPCLICADVTDTASGSAFLLRLRGGAGGVTTMFSVTDVGVINTASNISSGGNVIANNLFGASFHLNAAADGQANLTDLGGTVGIQFNSGTAAPTFNNGTVLAGSRNTSLQITLTGGNTGGVITFGAPAWTNAPRCIIGASIGAAAATEPVVTTTTITLAGHVANSVVTLLCIGGI